jgi:hypothetical protein
VILVRDIVNGLDEYGYEPSAAFDAFNRVAKTVKATGEQTADLATGEDNNELTRDDVKSAFLATGYFARIPSRQLWLTGEYFHDWLTGDEVPANVFDGLQNLLVTGKPRDE